VEFRWLFVGEQELFGGWVGCWLARLPGAGWVASFY